MNISNSWIVKNAPVEAAGKGVDFTIVLINWIINDMPVMILGKSKYF